MAKTKKHIHNGIASNTKHCFRTFIGCAIKGVLFNALPAHRMDLQSGNKTIVFDCGWGLTIASNGSYWTENPEDIARAIDRKKEELMLSNNDIRDVLQLAGETL